jgi:chemotaxis protein MotB
MKSTYDNLVSDLKKQIDNQEVTIKTFEEKISVTFVDRILFELGKATISPEGEEILRKVGRILKNVKNKQIRVEGHTDNIPIMPASQDKFPSNWELSAARAAAVVRHFQNGIGLDPGNLEAVGHSFYRPVASNETEEGRAQNRRVNIIIAPKIQ